MHPDCQTTVEFVGGPFDGHVESYSDSTRKPPEFLLFCITENAFRFIHGRKPKHNPTPTSIAIYGRYRRGDRWVYDFLQAVAPDGVEIELEARNSWQQE